MADRWPSLYDGVVAFYLVRSAAGVFPSWIWTAQTLAAQGAWVNPATQRFITQSVIAACDSRDGAVDGAVINVKECNFNPAVLRCPNGADSGDSLSDAQITGFVKC